MCGIAGWQLRESEEGLTVFEKTVIGLTLADTMENRGRDSFGGALWFNREEDPVLHRETGRVLLWGRSMLEQATLAQQFLMHTRAATTGAVTKENCHPFQYGKTLGVHNGIVGNHFQLNREFKRDFNVDSQHIFAHIEEKRDLSEVQAYGAIVFTDNNQTLNLCRFNHGTLAAARIYRHPATRKDQEHIGIIFASTEEAIRKSLERCNLYHDFLEIKEDEIYLAHRGDVFKTKKVVNFSSYSKPSTSSTGNSSCALVRTMGPRRDTGFTTHRSSEPERRKIITGPDGKQLNKRERKRIKRLLRGEGSKENASTLFNTFTQLQKCYMFQDIEGNDGKQYKIAMCPDCNCDILMHYAGKCLTPESQCKRDHCDTFQPCGSCGCYLVDQTHILETIEGVPYLYCEMCEEQCPIEQAKRHISWDDEVFEEAVEEPTEPVVAAPQEKEVALVLIGGGKKEDTEEIDLSTVTDADLNDKVRLSQVLLQFRENGEWNDLLHNVRDDS